MRITLLTGSLERDKDGVGDYTRWLATEAAARGVSCRLLALADRHLTETVTEREADIEIMRLPATMTWQSRLEAARAFLRSTPSDWVSLQFVPYSFHSWGLAGALVQAIPELVERARLHVMLHEIWIDGSTSWRRRLVSFGQRRSILALCRQPHALIHTSNGTYQQLLSDYGVRAQLLPLFGSIPIAPSDASSWLPPLLAEAGCDALSGNRRGWWLVTLFGTLHPIWPAEPLLRNLQDAAAAAGKHVAIISIGRLGAGERLWNEMVATYAPTVAMLRLGLQPASRISELLHTADFGIATTPLAVIGKSATVAAMLDHGLPVVVNREDCAWRDAHTPDARERSLLIRMNSEFAARLREARRLAPDWRLPGVATWWLDALKTADVPASAWSS